LADTTFTHSFRSKNFCKYIKRIITTYLKNNILLDLINLSSQAAVGDGIDDDWFVGFGTWLLEEFRTFLTKGEQKQKSGCHF